MARRLFDISPPITEALAVWPGDVPFTREIALDMRQGDNLTLSAIRASVHLGAHADGPSHYLADGPGIGERPLEAYFGPCQVIEVKVDAAQRILPSDLTERPSAPRILFKTGSYPDPNHFNASFVSLSPELVHYLHDCGVILVGLDTPSVDPFDDKELRSHQAIASHDMAILEGLVLQSITPGHYELVALPLPLMGVDASPVRAILWSETSD